MHNRDDGGDVEPAQLQKDTESPGPDGRVHVFGTAEYARETAAWVARRMRRAAAYRDRVALALSGDHIFRPVCQALAGIRGLPWRRVEVYFAEGESAGPGGSDEGGTSLRMAREALLSRVSVPEERVHAMGGSEDPEEAARRYGETLPERLDLVLLELGEDGRVAALVPGSAALRSDRRVVPVPGAGSPHRLTVSPTVLDSARAVAVLARGQGRSSAVARALAAEGRVEECPARLVRGEHWLLDEGAAAGLERLQD